VNPRVSVCVPVYNGEKYLAETLESICAQSLRDVEIVISDNASTDGTPAIIRAFAERDPRIAAVRNRENVGYCRNIAGAVARASSDIVAIFHADDVYHPDIAARELELLDADPAIGGVFSLPAVFRDTPAKAERKSFYKNLAGKGPYRPELNAVVGGYVEYLPLILEYGNIFACPSFMTRKPVFQELGGFTDAYPSNEDLELWIKYLESGRKLAIVNDFLLNYRMSEDHASAYWRSRPELAVMYRVLDEMVVARRPLSPGEKRLYARNRAVGYARAAVNAAAAGDTARARDLAGKSRREARLLPWTPFGAAQIAPGLVNAAARAAGFLARSARG
jgi:glycosyltransferase involved in cell wall biosynthesis